MSKLKLPVTRYYGSKRKLVELIWDEIENHGLEFQSVLDIFGGSGTFSYYSKLKGKTVFYNDIFKFNYTIGKALIENSLNTLTENDIEYLLQRHSDIQYESTIEETFQDIYFTDEENRHLDTIVQNIMRLPITKKDSAYYLLYQSCLIKRPYNLFHRKNLNLRTNFSGGGFGNKITWERTFKELFYKFNEELNEFVFDNNRNNIAINSSALKCEVMADLVYIDPPYFKEKGHVPYHSKYHFLEGLANYESIKGNIDYSKKHREISINKSAEFESKLNFLNDLEELFKNHSNSILIVSYRSNGVPSIQQIEALMLKYKSNVFPISLGKYNYALNSKGGDNYEFLIMGY